MYGERRSSGLQTCPQNERNLFRIILVVLLVVACGGNPVTDAPSAAAVETIAPTDEPSTAFSLTPTLAPDLCELAITAGDGFEDLLNQFGVALVADDADEMDRLVDEALELGDLLNDPLLFKEPRNPAVQRFVDALTDLDEARLAHMTGDSTPFIEALGDAALAGQEFRNLCA